MNTNTRATFTFARQPDRRGSRNLASLTMDPDAPCGCNTHTGATETLAEDGDETPAPEIEVPTSARWEGPLGFEDLLTGDGRLLEGGSLRWESLPIPLRFVSEDTGFHDGAQVVALIDTIERREGGVIWGSGPFDLESDIGREAFRLVEGEYQNGVSLDLDDASFEVRVAAEVVQAVDDLMAEDEDGNQEEPEVDEDGRVTVAEIHSDDEVHVITDARVRGATIVQIPAFADARIAVADADAEAPEPAPAEDQEEGSLVASGRGPTAPPRSWFRDPQLAGPTPLTVTDDGHVYGHLALWGTCHIGFGSGRCVTPPRSPSNYAYFMLGATRTDDGSDVPTGKLSLATGHAGDKLNATETLAHYENTSRVAADVTVGEDQHGIWFSGAVRPSATEDDLRALRAAPFSGDWRAIGGSLELVAALGVNLPGYPVPRPSGLVASGQVTSLVAAGVVRDADVSAATSALSADDIGWLKRLAARERADAESDRLTEAEKLAARVRSSRSRATVRAFAARRAAQRKDA